MTGNPGKKEGKEIDMGTKKAVLHSVYRKILIMLLVLIGAFFFSMCIGRYSITPGEVAAIIAAWFTDSMEGMDKIRVNVVMQARLPRILLSMLVGAGLACSGAAYQCLFGNPLVSPDILGVSAGAGFGAAVAILFSAGAFLVQLQALAFGLLAVGLVLLVSRMQKKRELYMLVLSGVIVSALFEALVSLVKYVADPQDKLPAITVWLMGSLASASYQKVWLAAATLGPCILVMLALRWKMNLLSLDEEEARSLGVNVELLRLLIIVASTLMTAVSVSLCGIIGWIGLVIPHICRFFVGNDHRGLLPACVISGAAYLLLIDGIARTLTAAELPLSILTAMIGAPFFAYMLRKTMGGKG